MNKLRYNTLDEALAADKAAGFRIIRSKIAPSVQFAFQETPRGKVWMKAYKGTKAVNPRFFFSFRSMELAYAYAKEFAEGMVENDARAAARNAEKREKLAAVKAADYWTVGDVGTYSWGYDQTNTEFYQVIEVGAKTIKIRRLSENRAEDAYMAGRSQPRRGEFRDDEILTKRVGQDGRVRMEFGSLGKWNGKSQYWSSYA